MKPENPIRASNYVRLIVLLNAAIAVSFLESIRNHLRLSRGHRPVGIQDEVRVNWHRHGPQSNSERANGRELSLSATYPANAP